MEIKQNNIEQKPSKKGNRNKIILLGEKNVGKTSIFSMIFTSILPSETSYFESTNATSLNQIIFSDGELIDLYDCGIKEGRDKKKNEEIYKTKDIFEDITTFIFVINSEMAKSNSETNTSKEINNIPDDDSEDIIIKKEYFLEYCLKLVKEKSPNANIFIFIHKIDTILSTNRKEIFEEKKNALNEKIHIFDTNVKYYPTSIWDGSLYVPWREIMCNMVMNKNKLEKGLNFLLQACNADEIFLFERNTLLCICSVDNGKNLNKEKRTKNISFLIKKLKIALGRNKAGLSCLKLKLNNIMAYFEEFNKYSYIMILSQPNINYELLSLNIYILKELFEKNS